MPRHNKQIDTGLSTISPALENKLQEVMSAISASTLQFPGHHSLKYGSTRLHTHAKGYFSSRFRGLCLDVAIDELLDLHSAT